MPSPETIWPEILALISARAGEETLQRWFSDISLVSMTNTELCLRAPNQIYQLWIESNFSAVFHEAIDAVLGGRRRLVFEFTESPSPDMAPVPPPSAAKRKTAKKPERGASNLNPRYRFCSFVVGPSNQHAVAVCQAIAKGNTGATYSPLFLHGPSGLGKTHLMHALGHAIMEERLGSNVVYVTCEQFTNEFIQAIGDNTLPKFRQKYRRADALLIDDIQFLAGKDRSQEEFFHTFNTLLDGHHKHVVLSADCSANKIRNLDKRLLSRFECGMTTELAHPELETRLAILHRKAEEWRIKVADPILEYMAHRIRNSVRRLEGALIRVAAWVSFEKQEMDIAAVDKLLRDIFQDEAATDVSPPHIVKAVAEAFDLRAQDITGRRRTKKIALARQVCMYLARQVLKASFEEIGDAFARDHGTIIHACRKIETEIAKNEEFRHQVEALQDQLLRQR